jgi:hypothetical protein
MGPSVPPLIDCGCGLKSPRLVKPAARIAALLAFLGGGCDKVAVPLYARTPTSAALAPVLEGLTGLLGPHFESLHSWKGRHDLLATADPTKWHQNIGSCRRDSNNASPLRLCNPT